MSLWRIFRSWMCLRPRQIWMNQSTIWQTQSSPFFSSFWQGDIGLWWQSGSDFRFPAGVQVSRYLRLGEGNSSLHADLLQQISSVAVLHHYVQTALLCTQKRFPSGSFLAGNETAVSKKDSKTMWRKYKSSRDTRNVWLNCGSVGL